MAGKWSRLHLRVLDGARKELVPARIHIKRPDGKVLSLFFSPRPFSTSDHR